MRIVPAILIFLLLPIIASSQRIIKGRVVNAATGTAVPGSSVFISSTSSGTVSNNAGTFELTDVPAGKHELVISCIGYETNVYSFSDEQLPLQLKVELKIKVKELQNVIVEPSLEEGWDKWGRTFMNEFVGKSENANQCRIKNEKAIRFRYYRKSNRLIAYCDEPVLLENKALGYLISYQLEEFEVNFNEKTVFYLGYPLFEPLDKNGKGRQQKWEDKRQEAHNGSIMHFMQSLYANRLLEEGFEVRSLVRTPNYEKQRVKSLYRTSSAIQKNASGNGVTFEVKKETIGNAGDSMSYYQSVMRQNDYLEKYGMSFLTTDSLIIDSSGAFKELNFENYLFITYRNEKEEDEYLLTQYPQRKAGFQQSIVTLIKDEIILLEKNGNYYDPRNFFTSYYWGWSEKMANSLPLDYEVGKK